jgi:hypothetical protein
VPDSRRPAAGGRGPGARRLTNDRISTVRRDTQRFADIREGPSTSELAFITSAAARLASKSRAAFAFIKKMILVRAVTREAESLIDALREARFSASAAPPAPMPREGAVTAPNAPGFQVTCSTTRSTHLRPAVLSPSRQFVIPWVVRRQANSLVLGKVAESAWKEYGCLVGRVFQQIPAMRSCGSSTRNSSPAAPHAGLPELRAGGPDVGGSRTVRRRSWTSAARRVSKSAAGLPWKHQGWSWRPPTTSVPRCAPSSGPPVIRQARPANAVPGW